MGFDPNQPFVVEAAPQSQGRVANNPLHPDQRAFGMEVYHGLLDRGMAPDDALAVAANGIGESGGKVFALNPTSGASGTFQWLGPRLEIYKQMFGHAPHEGNLDEHLDYLMWENEGPEAEAWRKVQTTKGGPLAKAAAFGQHWERFGNVPGETDKRSWIARHLFSSAQAATPKRAFDPDRPYEIEPVKPPKRAFDPSKSFEVLTPSASGAEQGTWDVPGQEPVAEEDDEGHRSRHRPWIAGPNALPGVEDAIPMPDRSGALAQEPLSGASVNEPSAPPFQGALEPPPQPVPRSLRDMLGIPHLGPLPVGDPGTGRAYQRPSTQIESLAPTPYTPEQQASGILEPREPPVGGLTYPQTTRATETLETVVPGQGYVGGFRAAGNRGVVTGVGDLISGVGDLGTTLLSQTAQRQLAAMDFVDKGQIAAAMKTDADRPFIYQYVKSTPEERAAQRSAVVQSAAELEQHRPNLLNRAGSQVTKIGEEAFPVAKENEGFGTEVAGTLGGIVPLVGAGMIGGAAGGPPGAVAVTLPMIGAQSFHHTLEEARQKGASAAVAERAAGLNSLVQMGIMALPIGHVIRAAPEMAAPLAKVLFDVGARGGEFAAFSGLGKVAENLIAQQNFDPQRGWTEGAVEAALVGAVAGSVMGAPGAFRARRGAEYDVTLKSPGDQARGEREGMTATADRYWPGEPPVGLPAPDGSAPPRGPEGGAPAPETTPERGPELPPRPATPRYGPRKEPEVPAPPVGAEEEISAPIVRTAPEGVPALPGPPEPRVRGKRPEPGGAPIALGSPAQANPDDTVEPQLNTTETPPEGAAPSSLRASIAELDARNATGAEYRNLLSTSTRTPLKKGETWRDRAVRVADSHERGVTPFLPEIEPRRLADFVRREGGVQDVGGDIRSMLGGAKYRPGLINHSGLSARDMMIRAWEDGYFPEHSDEAPRDDRAFLEALHEDLAGNPRYSHRDDVAVANYERAKAQNSEVARLAWETGIPAEGKTHTQFYDAVAEHMSVEDLAREIAAREAGHLAAFQDAERAALSAGLTPKDIYGGTTQSLEDIQREYQQEHAVAPASQGGIGGEQPVAPPKSQGDVQAGSGPRERGARTDGSEGTKDLLGAPIRTATTRAEPEPTVRNDERQIGIPGTAPSAVQAQAARDQKGRGALVSEAPQAKADEGLFAKPEVEQPPLPEIVEHVTKKGKTLRGAVRKDLTPTEAKAIDPYAFRKDGGMFIREQYLGGVKPEAPVKDQGPHYAAGLIAAKEGKPRTLPSYFTGPSHNSRAWLRGWDEGEKPSSRADKPFDPVEFDRVREARVAASREAGNIHLDTLQMGVEAMRGRVIEYVHDPKERGVISTVTNRGQIYVKWEGGPNAGRESFITEGDAKDFIVTGAMTPTQAAKLKPGQPVTAPTEHPGLRIKSLETGKKTVIQPPGTVKPPPSDIRTVQEIMDQDRVSESDALQVQQDEIAAVTAPPPRTHAEQNEALFDEVQAIMRRLPRDMGKVKREGRVTPGQQSLMNRLDEIERLLPTTGAEWTRIMAERRAAGDEKRATDAAQHAESERARLQDVGLAEGDKVFHIQPSFLPHIPGKRLDGTVRISKDGTAYVAADGKQLDPFTNPWTKVEPEQPKSEPPKEEPQPAPEDEGRFSESAYEKAKARLREKMGRLNSNFDPEMMLDGLTIAGYHVSKGARRFAEFSRRMIEDLGEAIRPRLRQFYEMVRNEPGFDTKGMDSHAEVERELQREAERPISRGEESGNEPVRSPTGQMVEQGTGAVRPEGRGAGEPEGTGHLGRLAQEPSGNVSVPDEGGTSDGTGVRPGPETVRGPEGVPSGGVATDGRGRSGDQGMADARAERKKPQPAAVRPNFHIDDPERLVGGTPKVRFARNRAAIEALAVIEEEQRAPTQAELEALAGYTGWGSFGQDLFQGTFERPHQRPGWDAEGKWLRDHLGKENWESAQRSIINAHYTDPPTVKAMWDMAQRMGFKGGRILEPSMGIGNFFGMMPRDVMKNSTLTGIELDRLTGQMAKLLYPDAGVHIKGYQDSQTPDNFYDMVIGNWPFAAQSPADRRYDKLSPTLHDYFFLKALDQTRSGGLVIGVTSSGTMDKTSRSARVEMAKKGALVAAFRLPSGAFEKYAGTSVVTDILVFQKRSEPAKNILDERWINATDIPTPQGNPIRVNEYFQAHPENVLGTLDFDHGTTQGRAGMIVTRPADLMQRLESLAARVPEGIYQPKVRGGEPRFISNNTQDRQGSVTVGPDGKLYQVAGERQLLLDDVHRVMKAGTAAQVKTRDTQVRSLVGMRKAYGALIDAERDGLSSTEVFRDRLREQYEAFAKAHGGIKNSIGLSVLNRVKDPSYPILASLELPDGTPSRILTEPTLRSRKSPENPSVSDAFIMARNETANLDMERVAALAKKPREKVESDLLASGAVFRTPENGFEPADSYIGGNVRRKLREAQDALDRGEDMQASVEALTKALPPTVPYYQIEAKLGAPWVSDTDYKGFIGHMLGLSGKDLDDIHVRFAGSRWKVTFANPRHNGSVEARTTHGHHDYPFNKLIMAAMGNNAVTIRRRDQDGNQYVDTKATEEVNAKIQGLRENFQDWAWSDPERKIRLEEAYNETMNAIAKPRYDGSFMDMSGMALRRGIDPFSLRQHQVNAIWRGVNLGRGLFAHEVGTGKSYVIGGIAVEGRRYGKFSKPLIFAHNANSAAVAREINDMYPGAKVLYLDNLSPETIGPSLYRIANDEWDAVVMPHSLIDRMTLSRETLTELAQDQISELENEAMEAAREDGVNLTPEMMDSPDSMKKVRSVTAKQLVKQREGIIANIEKQANRASREGAVPFEKLGIDAIIVDEAHEFKKPPIATRMKLKGLNTATSDRSIALNFLTGYVKRQNNGNGVYLFTGTPVTNALNEIFNMSRYFMDDTMSRDGIRDWDTWFNTFADATTDVELSAAGAYEPVNRLSSFVNVDELVRVMSEYTDVVQAKDMPEFTARSTPSGKTLASTDLTAKERDYLENGRSENPIGRPYKKVVTDVAEMSPAQRRILDLLQERSREFKAAGGKQRREWLLAGDVRVPIRVETHAANASLDARMYDPSAPDDPNSKVNRIARNVAAIYKEPHAGQVIFVDRGYAGGKDSPDFVLMKDLIGKLVKGGIPRGEISVVAGGVSAEKKKEIADAMNGGALRVVIGQSSTLGVGVNMQTNLRAMHHMDAPWRPGDLEQRNGRGERQGNKWNTVLEYRYITEGIDGRRWQVLTSKDRFIKQFVGAFNDESGRRLGSIEGDAADISDSEDIMNTLAAAAGDPRLMIREKYRADINRLERRERVHTQGVVEASRRAQTMRADNQQIARRAEGQRRAVNTWDDAVTRMMAAAQEAGDSHRWYDAEVGGKALRTSEEIQDAIDEAVVKLVPGETGVVLGTINGLRVVADWKSRWNKEPYYELVDADGDSVVELGAASLRSVMGQVRSLRNEAERLPQAIAEREATIERLEDAAKAEFVQREALARKRQQFAKLEEDLQANPAPPPGWLRHGAPVDSEIFVDGKPRIVRGHRMDEDYTVVTDEGEVPYLKVADENGIRLYEAHPAPVKSEAPPAPLSESSGVKLYSFPGMLFDPDLWKSAGRSAIAVKRRFDAMTRSGAITKANNFLDEKAKTNVVARQAVRAREYSAEIKDGTQEFIFPMSMGSVRAQSDVGKFANALRNVTYIYGLMDKTITASFNPAEREAMGRAMDNQSVFEQRLAKMDSETRAAMEAHDRGEFDAGKTGVAGLSPKQRDMVESIAARSMEVWEDMRAEGLVGPEAQGLPYYFARQMVLMDEDGNFSLPKGSGTGGRDINEIASNVNTRGPQRRKHLTPEETEAAAKAVLGDNAFLLQDIRSVVQRLATNERAIAGARLFNAIKMAGEVSGEDLVIEGDIPVDLNPQDYFTINHPSFRRWRSGGSQGAPAWQDVHVLKEYEGPLNAVLATKTGDLYKGFMKAKGVTMGLIMWSPLMHLGVEMGRAFPLLPGKIASLKFISEGAALRKDQPFMTQAIMDGLAPIGRGWSLDPTRVAEEAAIATDPKTKIGKAIEAWHKMHERVLWDNVLNLQMTIYNDMQKRFEKEGFDPRTSGKMAAHLANRYAGALPPEHLSKLANQLAHVSLFSRSFTLGNLGVMKDMMNGMPSHIRAQIEHDAGPDAANDAQARMKRIAQATVLMDVALAFGMTALVQLGYYAANKALGGDLPEDEEKPWEAYLRQVGHALKKVRDNPLTLDGMGAQFAGAVTRDAMKDGIRSAARQAPGKLADQLTKFPDPTFVFHIFPQHGNEPGKRDRALIGHDFEGRGTYLRTSIGKVGEEFVGWALWPGTIFLNKLNPMGIKPIMESIIGEDIIGRKILRPGAETVGDWAMNAGRVVRHFVASEGPLGQIAAHPVKTFTDLKETIVGGGTQDRIVQAAKMLIPPTGIGSVSVGYPGGPQAGDDAMAKRRQTFDLQQVSGEARKLYKLGKDDEAEKLLTDAGGDFRDVLRIMRSAQPERGARSLRRWGESHGIPPKVDAHPD